MVLNENNKKQINKHKLALTQNQGITMNAVFLPEDYISPRSNGSYTKLITGVNKIRILSAPVVGWEDWEDKRPVRYKMEDKPETWVDPKKPGKHFWSLIIWNYKEEAIQILHITQGSIRKAIEELSKDTDWGMPFFYDIKITREGEGLKTTYTVNPSPHRHVDAAIQKAFDETPCRLEALFDSQDPFALWQDYTSGVFEEVKQEKVEKVHKVDFDFANSEVKKEIRTIPAFDGNREASNEEFDSFIDAWSQTYDKKLLTHYIEDRSRCFRFSPKETVYILMNDQKGFEKEFETWSDRLKNG